MELDLPVIDLAALHWKSKAESDEQQVRRSDEELQKLRDACQQWGFFHVINHGINPTLIETVDSIARDMFSLPTDIKEKAILPTSFTGYIRPEIRAMGKESVPESMLLPNDHILHHVSSKLWPQGNHKFCEHIQEYKSELTELSHEILKLIISSLGGDVSKHYRSAPFENCDFKIRMNFYHNNKNLEATTEDHQIFSQAHTDIGCLTILYQDDVGGLQIRTKEGEWVNTKPLPGSFAVNIGDCLQMWSNCRYRSAEHRVVYGGCKVRRLSIALFMFVQDEAEICAPQELIDDKSPRVYRAFTFKELRAYFRDVGPSLGGSDAYFRI